MDVEKIFSEATYRLKQSYPKIKTDIEYLNIDERFKLYAFYIPALENQQKAVVISQGVHGVETNFTIGLNKNTLDKKINKIINHNTGVLFFFHLNPYGHYYNRRVNEDNIDLNRNFLLSFEKLNNSYSKLYDYLNPQLKVSGSWRESAHFWFGGLYNIIIHGKKNLRHAILNGQYHYPKGIFYGGASLSQSGRFFRDISLKYLSEYKEVLHIDYHSGYGERGKLHLLGQGHYDKNQRDFIDKTINLASIDHGNEKNFYETSGDITQFYYKVFKNKKIATITFEFGTLDSHTTYGSMESLRRIIRENQLYHFGHKTEKVRKEVYSNFLDLFSPSDLSWQKKAVKQDWQEFSRIIDNLHRY